jgi:hypothetical protein
MRTGCGLWRFERVVVEIDSVVIFLDFGHWERGEGRGYHSLLLL